VAILPPKPGQLKTPVSLGETGVLHEESFINSNRPG